MRITFVLPSPMRVPAGGAKVVYAHASGLAARGHHVTVLAPRHATSGWRAHLRATAVRWRDRWEGVPDRPFYAAKGVETVQVAALQATDFPNADAVIATGAQTARNVRNLPPEKGKKLYFIQGYETFADPHALDTWHYSMARITCAEWLRRAVEDAGQPVLGVVPNAVDPAEFFQERPSADRDPVVLMLYHWHPVKGPEEGLEVLRRLQATVSGLELHVFSARAPLHRLPAGIRLHVRPSPEALRTLYNRAAVLLHPSHSEGWPLVPMEAAACGCAVAGFANEGVQEYLEEGITARLVPVGDVAALTSVTTALLLDSQERRVLADAAHAAVNAYSWEASTALFERFLHEASA